MGSLVRIDALCIDQDNRKEQGHQVALIGRIYQKVAKVLIFVGVNAGKHGTAVKSLLADTRKMIQEGLENAHFAEDAFPYPAKDDLLLSDHRWASMGALLCLPWFSRGWVVQEAGLAAEATVIWEDIEFDWLDLMRTYLWAGRRAPELLTMHDIWISDLHMLLYQRKHKQEAGTLQPRNHFSHMRFHYLVGMARELKLTDERDRIYALLALQSDMAIEPNYEASYLQVYIDFARECLLSTHDITLLDEIQHTEDSIASEYPTWVPRWNINAHTQCWLQSSPLITSPFASLAPLPTPEAGNAIKVRVVLFDSIHFQFPLRSQPGALDRISALWQSLPDSPIGSPFPKRYRRLVFTQTLRNRSRYGSLKSCVAHDAALMLYLQQVRREDWTDAAELAHLEQRAIGGSVDIFINSIENDLINRSFVMTKRGYYGLAPITIREGDICAIIFGSFPEESFSVSQTVHRLQSLPLA